MTALPDQAALAALYSAPEYHRDRGHLDDGAIEKAKAATTLSYIRRVSGRLPRHGRYLEIGCSGGASLAAAAAAGWNCWGVEMSPSAAAVAARRPGIEAVHAGAVESAPLPRDFFDLIALFDVVEHFPDPRATLAHIQTLLKPRGLLLLLTPDGDSLSARFLGRGWPHLLSEHLVCFSRPGLAGLLSASGLRVRESGFASKQVNLQIVVHHATIHPDVAGGAVIRAAARLIPKALLTAMVPFNIGEFFMVAERPS